MAGCFSSIILLTGKLQPLPGFAHVHPHGCLCSPAMSEALKASVTGSCNMAGSVGIFLAASAMSRT